jgi:hypothetical protein
LVSCGIAPFLTVNLPFWSLVFSTFPVVHNMGPEKAALKSTGNGRVGSRLNR